MPFIGTLKYEKVETEESFVGRPVYRLSEQFGYETSKGKGYKIYCEKGFKTDFASIPEWFFFLSPKNGKWQKASVIHDKACMLPISYKNADTIFYYALLDDKASIFTAYLLYTIVRINHILVGNK